MLLAHPGFCLLVFSVYGLGSKLSVDHKSKGHGYHPSMRGLFPPSAGFAVLHKCRVRLCLLLVWNNLLLSGKSELFCFHESTGPDCVQESVLRSMAGPCKSLQTDSFLLSSRSHVLWQHCPSSPLHHHCIQHGLQGRSSFTLYFSFKKLYYLIAF